MTTLFDRVADPALAEKWSAWHAANPNVYRLFRQYAHQARAAGLTRYSADAILHRVRWHTTVETRGDPFRVNNNWASFLARQLIADDPSFDGFFELRRSPAKAEGGPDGRH